MEWVLPDGVTVSNNKITITKAGTYAIEAKFEGNETYKPVTAKCTLDVKDTKTEVLMFTAGTEKGENPSKRKEADKMSKDGVTVSSSCAAFKATPYELYGKNATHTISATNGRKITEIEFIGNSTTSYWATRINLSKESEGTCIKGSNSVLWTGCAESVEFSTEEQANIKSIKVIVDLGADENFKFKQDTSTIYMGLEQEQIEFNAADMLNDKDKFSKITYSISPLTDISRINIEKGIAYFEGVGEYTITAVGEPNAEYESKYLQSTATCTVIVKKINHTTTAVTFTPGTDKGNSPLGRKEHDEMTKDGVSISSTRAAFGGTPYKLYGDKNNIGSITVSAPTGGTIKQIVFRGNNTTSYVVTNIDLKSGCPGKITKMTLAAQWDGSADKVEFTTRDEISVSSIEVTMDMREGVSYELDEASGDNTVENCKNAIVTLKRTLESSHWNTFCVPFDLTQGAVIELFGVGTQLRTYDSFNGNIVNFKEADHVEAGKPYIMKPGFEKVENPTIASVNMVAANLDANGNPQAVGEDGKFQMKGIYNKVLLNDDKTNLFLGDGNKFYYPAKDDVDAKTMNGMRAYFIVPSGTDTQMLRANIDGTVTSLDRVFYTADHDAPVYNLQGQCVGNSLSSLKSGIYVQNGKKVIVK